jgi:hypothetical protein
MSPAAPPYAGVKHLCVHVVPDNQAVVMLYLGQGYEVEDKETDEGSARRLNRPRRIKLHKTSCGLMCARIYAVANQVSLN